jgi:chromosome segregation ATPase
MKARQGADLGPRGLDAAIYRLSWSMEDSTPQSEENEALSPRSATALRELEKRAQAALSTQQGQMSRLEEQISKQLEAINAAIADERAAGSDSARQVDEARAEVKRLRQELEKAQVAWQADKAEQEKVLAQRKAEFEAWAAEQKERMSQLDERGRELDAQQAALEKQRTELAERAASLQASAETADSAAGADFTALERERDELKQKFELALEDVQRFRGRAAELEQELARRPEANQTDSAELVALRAERDALAERIEQLERQPVTQVDADTEQEISDLRRRFELAVEDVRELKTKNAELETKLTASAHRPASSSDAGAMDWESQKRRLLASLEEATDDGDNPLPEKERVNIENTIEMTDAVVAEKDLEIERLKTELAAASEKKSIATSEQHDEQINQLLDADEVIAGHRKRVEQLEREMEDKLRSAELELSVERAKMARQKVELEELRIELESQRQAYTPTSGGTAPPAGAPRRRWLSKLGLSGDEQ